MKMTAVSNTENGPTSVSLDLSGAVVKLNHENVVCDENSSTSELSDEEDEDEKTVQLPSSALPQNSIVTIENSSDVIIGAVTQFHGPVTIYQSSHNHLPIQNDTGYLHQINGGENCANSSAKLVAAESLRGKRFSNFKQLPRKKLLLIAVVIFLILVSSSVLISLAVRKLSGHKEPSQKPTTTAKSVIQNSNHKFIDRTRWGGRDSRNPEPLHTPVRTVIISHTSGRFCSDFASCSREMQKAQSEAVVTGHPDVVYNFVIGGDGNIYIGRGWDIKNDHKLHVDTIDISFIGNFVYNQLSDIMIDAAKKLLEFGVRNAKLNADYKLYAHNHTENTVSPGTHVYSVIKTWPHYVNDLLTDSSL